MGSSSSHLVSSESPSPIKLSGSGGSILNRTKRKLSSLFCGVFTSKSTFQLEECPEKSSISCTEYLTPFDAPQNSTLEPSSVITSETDDTRTIHQNGDSSERNSCVMEEAFLESDLLNVQTSRDFEPLPHQVNEGGQQTAFCASGLHLDGTCSCESFFTAEESSSLASISRIIVLAEALFEVLDEIHHQSLSLSLSNLSLPAPESVVDTFPLKSYKKIKIAESDSDDVQQCYICLADYEEGDKLRVLPCKHEYHVSCIDKWLKEVNRVCPLCRHNVCEGPGECSISNAETWSQ